MAADLPSASADAGGPLWFYRTEQGKVGPFRLEELRGKLASAAISAETPVWRHGFVAWMPASDCEELAQAVVANRVSSVSHAGSQRRGPSRAVIAAAVAVAALLSWQVLARLLSSMAVAHVTGRVTAAAEPVAGGTVIMSPVAAAGDDAPGKPGIAAIGPDGSYSLRLVPGDRGLARRCVVRFVPPVLPPMSEAEAMVADPPYLGFVPKNGEVEIRAGANTIDVEIAPTTSAGTDRSPR